MTIAGRAIEADTLGNWDDPKSRSRNKLGETISSFNWEREGRGLWSPLYPRHDPDKHFRPIPDSDEGQSCPLPTTKAVPLSTLCMSYNVFILKGENRKLGKSWYKDKPQRMVLVIHSQTSSHSNSGTSRLEFRITVIDMLKARLEMTDNISKWMGNF